MSLDEVQSGTVVSAEQWNALIRLTRRRITGPDVVAHSTGWHISRPPITRQQAIRVRFQLMGPDHIEGLDDSDATVFVAKSWLLRRTPFDSNVPEPPPKREGKHYEYITNSKRVAIIDANPNADPPTSEEREIQAITEKFLIGDVFYAEKQDNTGVVIVDPDGVNPPRIVTLLMQPDNRAFAKVSE